MHGSICCIVKKCVVSHHGAGVWDAIVAHAGLSEVRFSPIQFYPDEAVTQLLTSACELLEVDLDSLLVEIGKFAAPELVAFAGNMIHPEWGSLELLANLEHLIHRTITVRSPEARPAHIQAFEITADRMQVVYSSRKGLCRLAHGILLGLETAFSEKLQVEEVTCTKRGDPFCTFEVTRHNPVAQREDPPATTYRKSPINASENSEKAHEYLTESIEQIDHDVDSTDFTVGSVDKLTENATYLAAEEVVPLPKRVGRYLIEEQIGAGGMGVVFRAIDETLMRMVAVKTTKGLSIDSDARDRFIAEAQKLARLSHPHVVRVFDVGELGTRPFFVMEYLTGESLSSRLRRPSPIPMLPAIRLFRNLVDGLNAVHEIGLIHRDVKPGNVVVGPGCSTCHLLDFGLAGSFGIAESGSVSGTLGFIAPERLRGFPGDFRSDFFSLGCLAYEIFAQQRAVTSISTTRSKLTVRCEWDRVPKQLRSIIEPMLEQNPDDRLVEASEIVRLLDQCIAEQSDDDQLVDLQSDDLPSDHSH